MRVHTQRDITALHARVRQRELERDNRRADAVEGAKKLAAWVVLISVLLLLSMFLFN